MYERSRCWKMLADAADDQPFSWEQALWHVVSGKWYLGGKW